MNKFMLLSIFMLMLGGTYVFASDSVLQDVESLSEDVIDYALENNTTKIDETLQQIEQALPQIFTEHAVSPEIQKKIQDNFAQMKTLAQNNDWDTFIVADNQLFAQFIDLMYSTSTPDVPKAVIDLDYLWRELQFQPKVNDWKATQQAATLSLKKRESLRPQIQDKGLKDLLDSTFDGLAETVQSQNQAELFYRGQLILDEVDLLEWYFEEIQSTNGNNEEKVTQWSNTKDTDDDDGDEEEDDDDDHQAMNKNFEQNCEDDDDEEDEEGWFGTWFDDEQDDDNHNDGEEADDYFRIGGIAGVIGLLLGMLIMTFVRKKKE